MINTQIHCFENKLKTPICLALGFFDSIHVGHQRLIAHVADTAKKLGCSSAVFTFCNNPFLLIDKQAKLVLTFDERVQKLQGLCDFVIGAKFDEQFCNTPKQDFLHTLFSRFDIRMICCGEDYKFGKPPQGDVQDLRDFCRQKNVQFEVFPLQKICEKKLASTLVRDALLQGDLEYGNKLLGFLYPLQGFITHGFGRGRKIGFPTANLSVQNDKQLPACGVYKTFAKIGQKKYISVTNVGQKPTFENAEISVETHIIGLDEDVYGQQLWLEFERKIRDIIRFENMEDLRAQIASDVQAVLQGESLC